MSGKAAPAFPPDIAPKRRARRRAGLLLVAGSILAALPAAAEIGFVPIELRVSPIETFRIGLPETRFGALEFRGGLELASRNAGFGSLSGLDFAPDGTLIAVADTGYWFAARLVEEDGRLIGLADGRLAPILDGAGEPITAKRQGDAEGLRVVARNGRLEALVSFEQRNDLRRFVAAPDLARARAKAVRLPGSVSGLSRNAGLEAVALAPEGGPFSGAIVLLAERSLDDNGNHRGWIVGGPRAGAFSLARSGDFDVTDAAFLADGDLLVLERRLNFTEGPGMRIRRVAASDLWPGRTVDGRVLVDADMRYQIDNMEGMALRPGTDGETLIMLCSDDNNIMIQRTILLQFALPPDPPPVPRLRSDVMP